MSDRDIREALEHAAADVLSPGSRIERWQGMVPKLLGRAGRVGPGRGPGWAPAVVRANRPGPAPRRGFALAVVVLVLLGAGASGSALLSARGTSRATASRVLHRQPPLLSLASVAPVCPFGESRYDNADAGYHFCLGTDWGPQDLTPSDRQIISVVGLRLGPGSSVGIHGDGAGPAIEVSVEWQSRATSLRNLSPDAAPTVIGGEPGFLTDDTADQTRAALVEHAGRVYRLQLHTSDVAAAVQFDELLRTFSFQRLPYVADPEFRLGKQTG
jgi:hypothetical protein